MKNKTVAGTLALMLGIFGVHRFYLDKKGQGILHLLLFFFTMMITIEENAPAIMIPAILGFIDAVLFFVMPQSDFDAKYNSSNIRTRSPKYGHHIDNDQLYDDEAVPPNLPSNFKNQQDPYRQLGIRRFRKNDYFGAVEAFQESLKGHYENPSTHFNLACTYSMLELAEDAFHHLDKAVQYGFDDFNKIDNHHALSFIRTQPAYTSFRKNNFQLPAGLPSPQEELLSLTSQKPSQREEEPRIDVLDQLLQLGDLKEKGLLTEEEFTLQKRKLLDP